MDARVKPAHDERGKRNLDWIKTNPGAARTPILDFAFAQSGLVCAMADFPIAPPIVVKDTPKPRRLTTLKEAHDYVAEALRIGRPEPWREVWHRLKAVTTEEDAIEAAGDLRELLEEEDLLLPSGRG
jgi:hypothetical protein